MRVKRIEQTIIPRTKEGHKFADEYCARLKSQGAYKMSECYLEEITITAEYFFEVKDDEVKE